MHQVVSEPQDRQPAVSLCNLREQTEDINRGAPDYCLLADQEVIWLLG